MTSHPKYKGHEFLPPMHLHQILQENELQLREQFDDLEKKENRPTLLLSLREKKQRVDRKVLGPKNSPVSPPSESPAIEPVHYHWSYYCLAYPKDRLEWLPDYKQKMPQTDHALNCIRQALRNNP